MPIPISLINNKESAESKSAIDYSFLASLEVNNISNNRTIVASDMDASLLFKLWKSSQSGSVLDGSVISKSDIIRLKNRGFIVENSGGIVFSNRGRKIITTMSLAEPNKFQNNAQEKSYREILAGMDKRNKGGYRIPKFASSLIRL